MKLKLGAGLALAAALALMPGTANAQSPATTELDVSITITDSCTVSVTAPVTFGSLGSLADNPTTSGTIEVNCTSGLDYDIALDEGSTAGATVEARLMDGPDDNTITYSLYSNDTHTTVWGDTVDTDTVAGTGTGEAEVHTVYARIEQTTTPPAGEYTDTVAVSVHY